MSVVIFKPDDIGDFVISSGAIRLIARHHGEENTTLVVKSAVAPLARREFPRAAVVELPWQPRRKGRNRSAANMRSCYPAWRRLLGLRADVAVCLRSARNFLSTFLFLAPRVGRRIAPENVLLRNGNLRRTLLERVVASVWRTELLPYPLSPGESTLELVSHRLVAEASLGREVSPVEIAPHLASASSKPDGSWLLCPFSSRAAKDYDVERWAETLRACPLPPRLRLAGGPDQAARLGEFASALRSAGVACFIEVLAPQPLENFPDLVARAALVLTVDTAAAHFACALGAPAVVVHCGLHNGVYGPYSPNGRQVWLMGDYGRLGSKRWRESVTPTTVADAIRRVLTA